MLTKEEHDKLTYVRYTFFTTKTPENWISAKAIGLFGKPFIIRWVIAKPGYPWSNN